MSIHRGPNTKKGGLVFGYDTGYGAADNSTPTRHYHGEPTTNLASTDSLRTMVQYADNTVASSDAPEKGPGWKKVTITNRGTNFRTAKFPYISHPTNTTRIYSLEIDFNGTSGYFIRGDGFSGLGPNQYTDGQYIATFTTTTGNGSMALFLNNGTTSVTGINDVIYYRNYQVETNNYKTPFTTGTRSSTDSLIDLTKSTDIDVSNVSFDSTGQPTFDGTNDVISIDVDNIVRRSTNITIDGIVEIPDGAVLSGGPWSILTDHPVNSDKDGFWWHMDLGSLLYFRVEDNVSGEQGITFSGGTPFVAGNTYHITTVVGSSGVFIYVNGELSNTYTPSFSWANISPTQTAYLKIGQTYPNYYLNSKNRVVRMYSRGLTANEIKQNYNTYKNRFNI